MSLLHPACGFFILIFHLCLSVSAFAADYRVSYAVDAGDVKDSGTVTCEYKADCKITSPKLKLSFKISDRNPVYRTSVKVQISDQSGRWGCCYFADGTTKAAYDTTESPVRFRIYVGRPRSRASEYLINEPFGILYLQFLDE